MVEVIFAPRYEKSFRKIKDQGFREKLLKQVQKIGENPEIGKPMRYDRKGTRELYVPPYRLAYAWFPSEQNLIFLEIYHKDEQ